MIGRIALTLFFGVLWYAADTWLAINTPAMLNQVAAHQFDNTAESWTQVQWMGIGVRQAFNFLSFVFAVIVIWIWYNPFLRLIDWTIEKMSTGPIPAIILGLIFVGVSASDAHAYRGKSNYTEIFIAKPSQTVYLIPMMGDTKGDQGKLNSEAFLKENKVAAKYVVIPHAKLEGTSYFANDYINSAMAVAVEHMPYAREYTISASRGTSARNEGIRCETKQSHEVTAEIAIGVVVREEDGAKYLYHFNVDMSKPLPTSQSGSEEGKDQTFVSAVAATSLPSVMDSFGFRVIQTALCDQFMKLNTDEAIAKKGEILEQSRAAVVKAFSEMGITVLNYGFAGPLTFDPKIQHAIDETYVAEKRALAAKALEQALPTMERQAKVELMLGVAEAAKNGKLPALPSIVGGVPSELMEPLRAWFAGEKK